ncbi:MAG: twin-arginine translocation signal domain-containing protein, partial [Cyclobacteriaceae bacterium]|nr:twin-arginine translocation signal domain-containing protein [Cyclobacteriaceae bacterium]
MKNLNRRQFLRTSSGVAAGLVAAPFIMKSCVFPSKQITIGMIGTGSHCIDWNLPPYLAMENVRVLAVCDVDKERMMNTKKVVDEKYQNTDCATYGDFRDLLARKDIDVVH